MARAYTYITKYTSPNQNARNQKVRGLRSICGVIRSARSSRTIVSWLCDKRAGTSAHYVVADGIVTASSRPASVPGMRATRRRIMSRSASSWIRRAKRAEDDYATVAALDQGSPRARTGTSHCRRTRTGPLPQCPGNYDLAALDRLARGASAPAGGAVEACREAV